MKRDTHLIYITYLTHLGKRGEAPEIQATVVETVKARYAPVNALLDQTMIYATVPIPCRDWERISQATLDGLLEDLVSALDHATSTAQIEATATAILNAASRQIAKRSPPAPYLHPHMLIGAVINTSETGHRSELPVLTPVEAAKLESDHDDATAVARDLMKDSLTIVSSSKDRKESCGHIHTLNGIAEMVNDISSAPHDQVVSIRSTAAHNGAVAYIASHETDTDLTVTGPYAIPSDLLEQDALRQEFMTTLGRNPETLMQMIYPTLESIKSSLQSQHPPRH